MQKKLIFFPEKLSKEYQFAFPHHFEEINYKVEQGVEINALYFNAEQSKGVVFYSHGNAGSLRTWGHIADTFLALHYDLLIYDYRTYGKSGGKISEANLYHDAEFIYKELRNIYDEEHIIVYGRSIGTGIASYISANFQPALLILESPYYNLPDLANKLMPFMPKSFVKYELRNDLHLQKCTCPVIIFHGTKDEIIYYGSSLKLEKLFGEDDRLVTLEGGHHNDLGEFNKYKVELAKALQ